MPPPPLNPLLICPSPGHCLNGSCNSASPCCTGSMCLGGAYRRSETSKAGGYAPAPHIPASTTTTARDHTITIPTLTMGYQTTVSLIITIPTLSFAPTNASALTSTLPSSSSSSTSTALATAQPPQPPTAGSGSHLTYLSLLVAIPLLFISVVLYKRWRKTHPTTFDAAPSPSPPSTGRGLGKLRAPVGLGTNISAWTGKGHRKYRGSAATTATVGSVRGLSKQANVKVAQKGSGGCFEDMGEMEKGRVTKWLGE